MKKPIVSIIILNYNGKKWLEKCLPTIKKLKYEPLEVLVVNNGSSDDSGAYVRKNFPQFRLIEIKKNRGFAGGNNIGVKKAKGKYVLLLNNDTEVDPNFIGPLVERMENDPSIGCVQPELRSMVHKNLIDSIGSFFTFTGFLYHYGYFQQHKKKQYQNELSVYSVKGACCMLKRSDYLYLGGLDEDFVCYVEESDLCHRILLSGKKIVYVPNSFIHHFGGGDMSIMEKNETTAFRSVRNRFYSYIKNFSLLELIKILPVLFVLSEVLIVVTILRGKIRNAIAAQWGLIWCILYLPKILKKRKYVQEKIRRVSDSHFLPEITKNPPFSYYVHFVTNPEGKYLEKPIS